MEKKQQLYEGKAKKVFATDDPEQYIVSYKDDATAFTGLTKGTISGKGVINNRMSNYLMQGLERAGIHAHFIRELSDRDTLVRKVTIVPLEVIVRNIAAGSMAKRLGLEEGTPLKSPVLEYCYKSDPLGDPMVNSYHILALGIATKAELDKIADMTFRINDWLRARFEKAGVTLVDFKIEFGRTSDDEIILADEISPDTCRLWDSETHKKLDKDRFRRDLGGVEDAYEEIFSRLMESSR